LEPVIRARYREDNPDLEVEDPDAMYQHPDHPWMLANPDGLIRVAGDEERGALEIKTGNYFARNDWDEGAPSEYMLQGQHYMEVLDLDYCDFAVLLGGNDYRTVRFERDRKIGQVLIERGAAFWEMIRNRTPPDPAGTVDYKNVSNMFPQHQQGTVHALTMEEIDALHQAEELRLKIKTMNGKVKRSVA